MTASVQPLSSALRHRYEIKRELGQGGMAVVYQRELARRALALEPYSEPAARLLIRAAALAGDTTGALPHTTRSLPA